MHKPTVTIPIGMDCRKPYGFNVEMVGRNRLTWELLLPMYLAHKAFKDNTHE